MIKKQRLLKGISQKELAKKCSISQAYVSKIEKGYKVNITIKEIIKIAKVLNIDELELAKLFIDNYKKQ